MVQGQVYINGYVTHPSHRLRFSDNQYICIACGFTAKCKLVKLKHICRPAPEARTAYAKAMLKRHAQGLNEDPRCVSMRTSSSSLSALLPHEVQTISNVEQSVNDIRRSILEHGGPYVDASNSDTSEAEECIRSVPVHDFDDSDPEFYMSEESGSE